MKQLFLATYDLHDGSTLHGEMLDELERVGWTAFHYEAGKRVGLPRWTLMIDAHAMAAARRKFDLAAQRIQDRLCLSTSIVKRSAIVQIEDASISSDVVETVEIGERLQRLMHRVME